MVLKKDFDLLIIGSGSAAFAAAIKATLHDTSAYTAEIDRLIEQSFGTVWLRHSPLAGCD